MNDQNMPEGARIAIHQGEIIKAVKLIRESSGLGLKESKDVVDAYLDKHPELSKVRVSAITAGGWIFWALVASGIVFLLVKFQ